MKNWIVNMGLLAMISCQMNNQSKNVDLFLKSDTIQIQEKRYDLIDPEQKYNFTLVRTDYGDSLVFKYIKDTLLSMRYSFDTKNGDFKLIQKEDNPDYISVDTFFLTINNEKLKIFKYEKYMPPIDGELGILFNQRYGRLGYSAYSWGNKTILSRWGNKKVEDDLKEILLADSVRYLKREKIVPPSDFETIDIPEEEIEPEMK